MRNPFRHNCAATLERQGRQHKSVIRQEKENNAYREFYDKQIAWRSPPR